MIPFTGDEYKQIFNDLVEHIRSWQYSHERLTILKYWLLGKAHIFEKLDIKFDYDTNVTENTKLIIEQLLVLIEKKEVVRDESRDA